MRHSRNTFIQENHPATRRRSLTTLDTFLRNTGAQSFLNYISDMKNHKKSLKQSEEAINSHFKKINSIISFVDDHIYNRLQNHQSQLFAIVKTEIEQMRKETQNVVQKLNEIIIRKNNEDQVWSLSNQLDYFKSEALKMFQLNKKMKKQIDKIRNVLKEAEIQIKNNSIAMQSLKKKSMKQHFIKQKLIIMIRQKIKSQSLNELTLQKLDKILKIDQPCRRLSYKPQKKIQSKLRLCLSNFQADQMAVQPQNVDQNIRKSAEKMSVSSMSEDISSQISSSDYVPAITNQKYSRESAKIKKQQKSSQTELCGMQFNSDLRSSVKPHFSSTTYIELSKQGKRKSTDVVRQGFSIKKYPKRRTTNATQANIAQNFEQNKRHIRYMSHAFNKNKVVQIRSLFKRQLEPKVTQ